MKREKAFPIIDQSKSPYDGSIQGVECIEEGMDLRDYFAAKALQSLMLKPEDSPEATCREAYRYADAMMEARK